MKWSFFGECVGRRLPIIMIGSEDARRAARVVAPWTAREGSAQRMSLVLGIRWRARTAVPCWALLAGVLMLACSTPSGPATSVPAEAALPADLSVFSEQRAWKHLRLLTRVGERRNGSRGARRTRDYLGHQLRLVGVESEEQAHEVEWDGERRILTHVVATLPGASPDVLLLATHYDTHDVEGERFVGANDGGSGAALMLELARVLAREPRPYTIWLAFLDGDALSLDDRGPRLGSSAFAEQLALEGKIEQIRMAVFFDQVADAELTIVRDLRSHRSYREAFFDAAERLGHRDAFPRSTGYGSPGGGHEAFLSRGVRPVVAIVDDRFGGPTPPGRHAHSVRDDLQHCSAASLGVVGGVTVEALSIVEERLARIDRFASRPLAGDPAVGSLLLPAPASAPMPDAADSDGSEPGLANEAPGADSVAEPTPSS